MPSFIFKNVYISDHFTIIGPKEKNGKILDYDISIDDFYFKSKTFELAEIKMQKLVIDNLIHRNKLCDQDFDYIIGGDLINQISITSSAVKNFKIPFIGVYSACATFVESLILASNFIENKTAKKIICVTSSHNLTAERQFRYPSEYGNSRPTTATSTVTSSVGAIVTNIPSKIKINSATIGKVIDLGVNDVNHMGAVMTPACADTLHEHLTNMKESIRDYDLILTGDLGCIGLSILKEYYYNLYNDNLNNVMDAGCQIFLDSEQRYSGGSGPCCLPLVFFCKILKNKKYKKILLLGTGSLHSPVMVNQHQTIPSISHAVSIEVI